MNPAPAPVPGVAVPELGPLLGRLTRLNPSGSAHAELAALRVHMVTELLEAGANARRLAEEAKPSDAIRAALGRDIWLAIFRETAEQAARVCLSRADERLAAARRHSRMPMRRFRSCLPSPDDRRIVINRARAAGIPLERVTAPESVSPPQWHEALRHTAGALEESWDRLERAIAEELERSTVTAREVAAWRRAPEGFWAGLMICALLALALGLSLGGYLPAPGPLATLRAWWWSLPWP